MSTFWLNVVRERRELGVERLELLLVGLGELRAGADEVLVVAPEQAGRAGRRRRATLAEVARVHDRVRGVRHGPGRDTPPGGTAEDGDGDGRGGRARASVLPGRVRELRARYGPSGSGRASGPRERLLVRGEPRGVEREALAQLRTSRFTSASVRLVLDGVRARAR